MYIHLQCTYIRTYIYILISCLLKESSPSELQGSDDDDEPAAYHREYSVCLCVCTLMVFMFICMYMLRFIPFPNSSCDSSN